MVRASQPHNQHLAPAAATFAARLTATFPDPAAAIDDRGLLCEANSSFCRLLGRAAEQLIGQRAADLFEPYNRMLFRQLLAQTLQNPGEALVSEASMLSVDPALALTRYTLIGLPDGLLALLTLRPSQEVIQLSRDLALLNEDLLTTNSQLAGSVQALAQERAHLDLLHQLSLNLSQSLDLEQVLGDVLFSTMLAFGAEAAGLLLINEAGQPAGWYPSDTADATTTAALAALRHGPQGQALRTGTARRIDDYPLEFPQLPALLRGRSLLVAPMVVKDGPLAVLTLTHSQPRFFSKDQETVLFTAAETSALAIRNAQLYTRLREAEVARERMTNLLVHDLRSPLMATHASIEIAKRAMHDDRMRHYIDESLEAGLRSIKAVVDLTNDMLATKKLQAGVQSIETQAVLAEELCAEVRSLLKTLAFQQEVKLSYHVVPRGLALSADRRLLQRVLVNLVSNGLRFTKVGGEVAIVVGPAEDNGMLFAVEDRGPGVPEADRERIFEAFVQGAGEGHRGTGLGLSFCHEVVQAHGGRIWVEDRDGGGSRFCIWLPRLR